MQNNPSSTQRTLKDGVIMAARSFAPVEGTPCGKRIRVASCNDEATVRRQKKGATREQGYSLESSGEFQDRKNVTRYQATWLKKN